MINILPYFHTNKFGFINNYYSSPYFYFSKCHINYDYNFKNRQNESKLKRKLASEKNERNMYGY